MTAHLSKPFLPALSQQASEMLAPMQREIDRMMSDFNRTIGAGDVFGARLDMDYSETKDGVELAFEVPGMSEKDLQITIDDDTLTVSGEKKARSEEKDKDRYLVERRYGAFSRSVRLPRNIDAGKINAILKDGVLTVTAPKNGGDPARTIAIQAPKA